MNICDDPNRVSVYQEWREGDFIQRVPIIVTGNDLSHMFAPLVRDGRMTKFYWKPDRTDLSSILHQMYKVCLLSTTMHGAFTCQHQPPCLPLLQVHLWKTCLNQPPSVYPKHMMACSCYLHLVSRITGPSHHCHSPRPSCCAVRLTGWIWAMPATRTCFPHMLEVQLLRDKIILASLYTLVQMLPHEHPHEHEGSIGVLCSLCC